MRDENTGKCEGNDLMIMQKCVVMCRKYVPHNLHMCNNERAPQLRATLRTQIIYGM